MFNKQSSTIEKIIQHYTQFDGFAADFLTGMFNQKGNIIESITEVGNKLRCVYKGDDISMEILLPNSPRDEQIMIRNVKVRGKVVPHLSRTVLGMVGQGKSITEITELLSTECTTFNQNPTTSYYGAPIMNTQNNLTISEFLTSPMPNATGNTADTVSQADARQESTRRTPAQTLPYRQPEPQVDYDESDESDEVITHLKRAFNDIVKHCPFLVLALQEALHDEGISYMVSHDSFGVYINCDKYIASIDVSFASGHMQCNISILKDGEELIPIKEAYRLLKKGISFKYIADTVAGDDQKSKDELYNDPKEEAEDFDLSQQIKDEVKEAIFAKDETTTLVVNGVDYRSCIFNSAHDRLAFDIKLLLDKGYMPLSTFDKPMSSNSLFANSTVSGWHYENEVLSINVNTRLGNVFLSITPNGNFVYVPSKIADLLGLQYLIQVDDVKRLLLGLYDLEDIGKRLQSVM